MSVSDKRERERPQPHLVFLPSGIGNSTPFLRLAVAMSKGSCRVTFINLQPQPVDPGIASQGVEVLDFQMLGDSSSDGGDPFIGRVSTLNRALSQLNPTLISLRASAMFSDFAVAATLAGIADELSVPLFIVSTTSAKFLALVSQIPLLLSRDHDIFSNSGDEIEVKGMGSMQKSNIPAAWLHNSSTNQLLTSYLLPNARALSRVGGVLLNTFTFFEQETLAAIGAEQPRCFPIGPLRSYEQQESHHLPWFSEKPAQTVVYVNFGSTDVISPDQTRELRKGLEECGYHYLWVMNEGADCHSGRQDRGMIVRGGVEQESVLADPAIGVFVNQCEWHSIMQAAWEGVAVLAWPQHGDQRMNAEAVEKSGLGVWMKEWSGGGDEAVEGHEIGRVVKQMMGDLKMKRAAKDVRERAREASGNGGSSEKAFQELMHCFH